MNKELIDAKNALDSIIKKSRVHFYKPIQIAEILFHHRNGKDWNLADVESYRNVSKRWRDHVSTKLVGRKSTSSQKYQDNIFEANAMPPKLLAHLGEFNKESYGSVELYIYSALKEKLSMVHHVQDYIEKTPADKFSVKELVGLFVSTPGLKRSVDKIYEIAVYALFSSIVRALKVQITIEIGNYDKDVLKSFESFIKIIDLKKNTFMTDLRFNGNPKYQNILYTKCKSKYYILENTFVQDFSKKNLKKLEGF
jgi:type II restriction enzyme